MLVSVIIPTFNRAGKVLRALDSVLRQSYAKLEVIVVDDGSTDNTENWIQGYADPRLQYCKISHGGVARARNYGVGRASADWVCFLDSDDVWRRHKISEQLRYHAARPELLFSQTEDIWIRNSVRVNKMKKHAVREGDLFRESLKLCLICCSSVMIRKDAFLHAGGFDESLPTCEDYDLWLKLTAHYPVGFIDKPLVTKFGGHEDQLSKAFPMMDQYRIRSMENLLRRGDVSQEQRNWTLQVLEEKRRIVESGARKRML